ncbi:MAG: hypothetical protein OEZ14_05625 [Acidimicrobiia bacterium]|nr:hypothetical protein [Acidimicrobiia bacterium]MDH5519996.1 hypothetical protein [Acidimicrobiia bacterium]
MVIEFDRRPLVAVCAGSQSPILLDRLRRLVQAVDLDDFDPRWIEIAAFVADEPDPESAARHHLVIGHRQSPWVDVTIPDTDEDPEDLVLDRLVPWVAKWRLNRRAARRPGGAAL